MSIDDPSAKDSVVLGADLVAALGFEPVTVEPDVEPHPVVAEESSNGHASNGHADHTDSSDDDPASDTAVNDEPRTDDLAATDVAVIDDVEIIDEDASGDDAVVDDASGSVESTTADPSADAENSATDAQEATMATETEADVTAAPSSSDRVDDIDVVDDLEIIDDAPTVVEDAVVEDGAASRSSRGRFGVRGLFSRQAESVIDAESGSTRDLFANDAADSGQLDAEAVIPVDDQPMTSPSSEVLDASGSDDLETPGASETAEAFETPGASETAEAFATPAHDPSVEAAALDEADEPAPVAFVDEAPTASLDLTAPSGSAPMIDLDPGQREELELERTFAPDLAPGEPVTTRPASGLDLESATAAAAASSTSLTRPTGRSQKKLRAKKSRRVIRHIDPWSVLTFSILFHLAFFSAMLLAGVLVWNAAIAAGTVENVENFIRELADYETFEINSQQVFRAAVIISGMLTLASSVLVVLLTVVFNLISDLVGGIRITVIEEETVRVREDQK
ncbi:MAG: DUF3566 domain-containing protein [Acidimicrobiales bacterium]